MNLQEFCTLDDRPLLMSPFVVDDRDCATDGCIFISQEQSNQYSKMNDSNNLNVFSRALSLIKNADYQAIDLWRIPFIGAKPLVVLNVCLSYAQFDRIRELPCIQFAQVEIDSQPALAFKSNDITGLVMGYDVAVKKEMQQ